MDASSGYGGHDGELVYGDEYVHDVVGDYERGDEQGVRGKGEELTALLQMCKAGSGESSPERIDGVVVRWP